MRRSISEYVRSNAVAFLALFVALGGTGAYAVNTIGSGDVIDESLMSVDIRNGQVRSPDIGDMSVGLDDLALDSVKGNRVVENTLTGNDIKEITLGTVPKAASVGPGAVGTDGLADGSVTPEKNAEPADWHYVGAPGEPVFRNEWENYSTVEVPDEATWQHVSFRMDNDHVVHVRGLAANGEIGEPIFTLPADYCPMFFHPFPVLSNDALGRITVEFVGFGTDGGCEVIPDFGSNEFISLEGVSFLEWRTAKQQTE